MPWKMGDVQNKISLRKLTSGNIYDLNRARMLNFILHNEVGDIAWVGHLMVNSGSNLASSRHAGRSRLVASLYWRQPFLENLCQRDVNFPAEFLPYSLWFPTSDLNVISITFTIHRLIINPVVFKKMRQHSLCMSTEMGQLRIYL